MSISFFLYIIIFIVLLWVGSFFLPHPKGVYGSARFISTNRNGLKRKHKGLVIDGVKQLKKEDIGHTLVTGMTGSGKTQAYILPSCLKLEGSLIVLDVKDEIHHIVKGHLSKTHNVMVIDFGNPTKSLQYNPLSKLKSTSDIRGFSDQLYETSGPTNESTPIWKEMSKNLFVVALHCTLNLPDVECRNMANFLRIMYSMGSGTVDALVDKYVKDEDTIKIWKQYLGSDQKLKSNILVSALAALSPLNTEENKLITAADTLSFELLRKKPCALFIKIPTGNSGDSFYPIISILFNQLFSYLLEMPAKVGEDQKIYMLLDEFAFLTLQNFDRVISLIRGNGQTSINILLQDLRQLKDRYGENKMETILANISHFIFYPGLTGDTTLNYVQKLVGISTHKFIDPSTGTQRLNYRPLLTTDEIRTMNHALYIGRSYPSKINPKPLYKQKKFLRMCGITSTRNKLHCKSHKDIKTKSLPVEYFNLNTIEIEESDQTFRDKLKDLLPYSSNDKG